MTVIEVTIELASGRRLVLHYADREGVDVALTAVALTELSGSCELTDAFGRRESFLKSDLADVVVRPVDLRQETS
jgi:hypothetical protein